MKFVDAAVIMSVGAALAAAVRVKVHQVDHVLDEVEGESGWDRVQPLIDLDPLGLIGDLDRSGTLTREEFDAAGLQSILGATFDQLNVDGGQEAGQQIIDLAEMVKALNQRQLERATELAA